MGLIVTSLNIHVGRELQGIYSSDRSKHIGVLFANSKVLEIEARYNFFLSNDSEVGTLLFFATFGGFAYNHFLLAFSDIFMLMMVLTLWAPVKSFANYLKDNMRRDMSGQLFGLDVVAASTLTIRNQRSDSCKWREMYQKIKFLMILANLVNNSIGHCITLYIMAFLTYYATSMDDIFVKFEDDFDFGKVMNLVFVLVIGFSIFLVAAEVHHQVHVINRLES